MLRWMLAGLLAVAPLASRADDLGVLTLVDGEVSIVRDTRRFLAGEGVRVQADDLVHTASTARVARIEYTDGGVLDLGPGSAAWIAPRVAGTEARRPAVAYLAHGWARWTRTSETAASLQSPRLDVVRLSGVAVMRVEPGADALFAEAGRAELRTGTDPAPLALSEGDAWRLQGGAGQRLPRVPAEWATAMPRALADTLPRRAARWQGQATAPAAVRDATYEDVAAWINAEPALRPIFLARFGPLVRDRAFRAAAVAELRLHPEWKNLLFPPPPKPTRTVAAARPGIVHAVGQRAEAAVIEPSPEIAP